MLVSSCSFWICWIYFCLFPLHSNWYKGWISVIIRRLLFYFFSTKTSAFAEWTGKSFIWFYSSISPAPGLLASRSYANICLLKHDDLLKRHFTPKFTCWQEDSSPLVKHFLPFQSILDHVFQILSKAGKYSVFSHPRFFSLSFTD